MKCILFNFTGWAYDMTGYYPFSFFIGGAVAMIASVLLLPIRNYRHDVNHKETLDRDCGVDKDRPETDKQEEIVFSVS